jgi:N-acetylmuramoyl-L-alanine amidase
MIIRRKAIPVLALIEVLIFSIGLVLGATVTKLTALAPSAEKPDETPVYISTTCVDEHVEEVKEPPTDYLGYTMEEIELMALVTMAEAEGESELGKRLVIDTILNRVDHKRFPNTVNGVVYQKNAFESMWNGRVDRCEVRDDICQLVKEEIESRTNEDVVFFQMYSYSPYGIALFKEGCHYFSEYK